MFSSTISSSLQALAPFRSHSSSVSDSSDNGTENDIYTYSGESSQAPRELNNSEEDISVPPPSYEEVVSDTSFVPGGDTIVAHHENNNPRKKHRGLRTRFLSYGYNSSKIYVRE